MFTSIFAWYAHKQMSPCYTAVTMILGDLRKVGLNEEDLVIIAADSPEGSWRKDVDSNYKANRREAREKHDINWKQQFASFDNLLCNLDMNTPFHVLKASKLEADDIIAYGVKKFKDRECIIISSDTDYEQLVAYENVKLFSPKSKRYKHIKDPYKILAKKIKKEAADNLITEIANEEDFDKRNMIVNLISLPEVIEEKVEDILYLLPKKDWDYRRLFYMKSLENRYKDIYKQDKIVDFNKAKKKKRKKEKK